MVVVSPAVAAVVAVVAAGKGNYMKAIVQRVSSASVEVEDRVTGEVGHGLMILLCAVHGDSEAEADYLARKIAKLRIFSDENGKTNLSIMDVAGSALVVSQFTLAANWKKGNRPSFMEASAPDVANQLYEYFCEALRGEGVPVETGVFAAKMQVSLVNEGPFTIWMDTEDI